MAYFHAFSILVKVVFISEIYVTVNAFSKNETFVFNTATSLLKDHVCPAIDVLATSSAKSDVQCTYFCLVDVNCKGTFYQDDDNVCVLCSQHYVDTTGLESYPGMEYLQVMEAIWTQWGSWSTCSSSCGGGTMSRTRTCHPASLLPCEGTGESSQTSACNTNPCPPARTCADLAAQGLSQSGMASIEPLDNVHVDVYCDFDSDHGTVWTVMGHNRETRTHVTGMDPCYSYSITVTYDIGLEAAKIVVDMSSQCKQHIKFECKHVSFRQECVGWKNRYHVVSTYFTGTPPPGKYCACGDMGTCAKNNAHCNCRNNDDVWREDGGFVTNRSDLPITGFVAGDTGSAYEEGYHTIGKLMCA